MAFRTRLKTGRQQHPGTLYRVIGGKRYFIASGSTEPISLQLMNDHTQPEPYNTPQNLFSKHSKSVPIRVNGKYRLGFEEYECVNYNPNTMSGAQYAPMWGGDPGLNSDYWVTKALASMNPDVPSTDIPLFIYEFKDLPRMFRQLKRLGNKLDNSSGLGGNQPLRRDLPREIPEGVLAHSFGYAPLINDLVTIAGLADELSNRSAHRERLEKGSRFSRSLGDRVLSSSVGSFAVGDTRWLTNTTVREKVWFTAFASVSSGLPLDQKSPGPAIRRALGLNGVSASTAWNAIPFSWLSDYFFNIGQILEANRGLTTVQYKSFCLMIEKSFELQLGRRIYGSLNASGGTLSTTFKTRSVVSNPQPRIARKPALTGGQIRNIAALAANLAI